MKLSKSSVATMLARPATLAAGSVAAAAATALWVQRKARRAEHDFPPIGQFVDVDGVRLHYVERGEGPPVVLLPGNAVLLQDFLGNGLIDRLSEQHRVIAFDRPGFGYSERPRDRLWTAEAQAALLQQAFTMLSIDRPVVLGHSWGTLVALALALKDPANIRGLVLVSGYYYPTMRVDVPMVVPTAVPVVGDVMRYTITPLFGRLSLNRLVKTMFAPMPVPPDFFETLPREMMLRPSQIRANAEDAAFMIPAVIEFQKRYAELTMPVRLLVGSDDKIVDPEAHSVRLHRELPHSQLAIVPHAGHMVHYAQPDEAIAAVARVFQQTAGAQAELKAA